ncbi:MAG TPA: inosine/xanthosine triphosphatase [Blastocatellia bacterium]|nr:inosine/xanthosine triphosphatase [Blastocatellia bacterium]
MTQQIIFAVGSENPIKINCVAEAAAEFWPEARAIGINTNSLVSAQPASDHEMFMGALNRARQALAGTQSASYGVGVEGGILDTEDGMWAYAWVVIVDRAGNIGKGQTGHFMLPEGVARLIREEGLELGEADDRFFGRSNSKQQEGAIGILSDGRITRLKLYKPAVTFALLPFIHPEYYSLEVTR